MEDGAIRVERRGRVALVIIDRPQKRNALNVRLWRELAAAFEALAADPEVRVAILRGAGEEAFASGADLHAFTALPGNPELVREHQAAVEAAMRAVEDLPAPVIAMIFGYALGGGCELAVACDLRLASDEARFGIPAARMGIVLRRSNVQALVDLIGPGRAKELLFTGRRVDAREALAMGLVNEVLPRAELEGRAFALAGALAENSPVSVRGAKAMVRACLRGEPEPRAEGGYTLSQAAYLSDDFREGVDAFVAKRKPIFPGR